MKSKIQKRFYSAVQKLLLPLARIFVRHGVSHKEFCELAKHAFVEVAERDFSLDSRKQSVSRIAVLTGLTRKEVSRVLVTPLDLDCDFGQNNRAERVVSGWLRDDEYHSVNGQPAELGVEQFAELVKCYSGDMPWRAVWDELIRTGVVKEIEGRKLRLVVSAYVPAKSEEQKIDLFGESAQDLLSTLDYNLNPDQQSSRLQMSVAYDNLPSSVLPELKNLSQKEVMVLLKNINSWLSERDRDANPKVDGEGRYRAGIGVYYFEEDMTESRDKK